MLTRWKGIPRGLNSSCESVYTAPPQLLRAPCRQTGAPAFEDPPEQLGQLSVTGAAVKPPGSPAGPTGPSPLAHLGLWPPPWLPLHLSQPRPQTPLSQQEVSALFPPAQVRPAVQPGRPPCRGGAAVWGQVHSPPGKVWAEPLWKQLSFGTWSVGLEGLSLSELQGRHLLQADGRMEGASK